MSKNSPLVLQFDGENFYVGAPGVPMTSPGTQLFITQKFALDSRDLSTSDIGRTIVCPYPVTLSIPAGLPPTFFCYVSQSALGSVQFIARPGVTINSGTASVAHPTSPASPNIGLPGYLPEPMAFLNLALYPQASLMVQSFGQDVFRVMIGAPGGAVNA